MATFLIRPDNGQPAEFVHILRGHVYLRFMDTVTPAGRWFKQSDVSPHLTDMIFTCARPPRTAEEIAHEHHWHDVQQARIEWNWPHVFVTPEQAASINASDNVRLCIRKPAPVITLWHEGMAA